MPFDKFAFSVSITVKKGILECILEVKRILEFNELRKLTIFKTNKEIKENSIPESFY